MEPYNKIKVRYNHLLIEAWQFPYNGDSHASIISTFSRLTVEFVKNVTGYTENKDGQAYIYNA